MTIPVKNRLQTFPEKSGKKDFIFNMYGSMIVSFVSVILLVVVSRMLGDVQAGVFSLAYSTAQMLYTLAVYEVRSIQVTDEKKEFTFSDVFSFRIITIIGMLLLAVGFCVINSFDKTKTIAILLFCVYMAFLSLCEVFQGNVHKKGYLFISGFSLGTSVLLAAVAFVGSLVISRGFNVSDNTKLVISIIPMIAVMLLWCLVFDIRVSSRFDKTKPKFNFAKIKKLSLYTTPLIISVFINQYSLNCPKYAIDKHLTDVDQSHYGYLVMPAFCINLLSMFVFRPQMLTLSKRWANKEYKSFNKTVTMLFAWVWLATVLVVAGGFIAGIPVLEFLYGADLSGKKLWLMVLLFGGGFSAASSLCCTIVAITRKQNFAIFAYIIAATVALFLPNLLVKDIGFAGAPISYLIQNTVLFTGLFIVLLITVFSKGLKKENEVEKNG